MSHPLRALLVASLLFVAWPAIAQSEEEDPWDDLFGEELPPEPEVEEEEPRQRDAPRERRERPETERGESTASTGAPLTSTGAPGLVRVVSARGLEEGTFGFALTGEYMRATNFVIRGDEVERIIGSVSAAWSPLDWLTVFGQLGARSATNSLGDPLLIQSVGEVSLGAVAGAEVSRGIYLGGMLRLGIPPAANEIGVEGPAISSDLFATTSIGLHEAGNMGLPWWIHLNVGFVLDRSAELFGQPLGPASRFGHHVHDYDRFRIGLGTEVEVGQFSPFGEFLMDVPLSAPCNNAVAQACVSDEGISAWPAFITLGTRFAPLPQISLLGAFEFGMTSSESQGTPAVPAWNLIFGAAWHIDPRPVPPEIVEIEVESEREEVVAAPPEGWLTGRVLDQQTELPIEGARIRFEGTEWSAIATNDDGAFRTPPLPAGSRMEMVLEHPRYRTRTLPVTINEGERAGDLRMVLATEMARIQGVVQVRDSASLVGALVAVRGEVDVDLQVDPDTGRFLLEVEPGRYIFTVSAPGHHALRETVDLTVGLSQRNVELRPLQDPGLPRWSADAIVFDGTEPRITFDGDDLTPEGAEAMALVARLIAAGDRSRVLVRIHTDDRGDVTEELDVADARSTAILAALAARNLPADRFEIELVGSAEPLYPNVNARNRLRNNRVEFIQLFLP